MEAPTTTSRKKLQEEEKDEPGAVIDARFEKFAEANKVEVAIVVAVAEDLGITAEDIGGWEWQHMLDVSQIPVSK